MAERGAPTPPPLGTYEHGRPHNVSKVPTFRGRGTCPLCAPATPLVSAPAIIGCHFVLVCLFLCCYSVLCVSDNLLSEISMPKRKFWQYKILSLKGTVVLHKASVRIFFYSYIASQRGDIYVDLGSREFRLYFHVSFVIFSLAPAGGNAIETSGSSPKH
jgi:hypothetical protein